MKKCSKKILSIFLAMLVVFTCVPLNAFATNEYETEENVSYKATNALGEVLIDAVDASDQTDEFEYFISDVAIDDLTASVSFCAPVEDVTLLVAIYDEQTDEMLSSGNTTVNSSQSIVEIELDDCVKPEYFIVKAFMLDNNNAPVCANYKSTHYTKSFQDFLEKTVYDFDDDKVINLDYGYESNFAVVSDDAVIIELTEKNENILTVNDYENGKYVFENATEEISSLKEGDILYFTYGDGFEDYILTKVGNIEIHNSTVTITAETDFELYELFSYIKIDTLKKVSEQEMYSISPMADFDDESGDGNYTEEYKESISKEYESDDINVSFKGELALAFEFQFYYDFFKDVDYYEIFETTSLSFTGTTTIKAEAKKEWEPFVLFHGGVPICPGLEAEVEFSIRIELSASIEATGKVELSFVAGFRKIAGQEKQDLSKKPKFTVGFDISGNVTVDLVPSLSVGIKVLKVISVNLGVSIDIKFKGTIYFFQVNEDTLNKYPSKKHKCKKCIEGNLSGTLSLSMKAKFGLNKKKQKTILQIDLYSKKISFGDCHVALKESAGEIYQIASIGLGKCPNIEYKTTLKVVDDFGNALEGVKIIIGSKTLTTDENGQIIDYFTNGSYNCSVSLENHKIDKDKHISGKVAFVIHNAGKTVNIYMKEGEPDDSDSDISPDPEPEPNPLIDFGKCGNKVTWELYENGELIISGTGPMYDYCSDQKSPLSSNDICSVVIKNGVTSIGDGAFCCCENLTSVVIPNSIKVIGDHAFESCISLNGIMLPSSITNIGSYTFAHCTNLTSIVIPKGVTDISDNAFTDCLKLTNVTIPDTVINIGMDAFSFCENLKNVKIPEGVKSIENNTFRYCSNLVSVTIPNSITNIGNGAFYHCYNLKNITIPYGVTNIGDEAFWGCWNLLDITIPNSVTIIGKGAFSACWTFTNISIPNSVISIGDNAFSDCWALKNVTISENVRYIGKEAFAWCRVLESIVVDEKNTFYSSVDGILFNKDKTLLITYPAGSINSHYIIPDTVTSIDNCAFNVAVNIINIVIPDGVTSIGDCAFYGCDKLENIKIPDSVINIGYAAFFNCTALEAVYYTGTEAQWDKINIGSSNSELTAAQIICSDTISPALMVSLTSADEGKNTSIEKTTETVTSAVKGNSYVILVVRDFEADDLLHNDNLIYIDQKVADEDTLSFEFVISEEIENYEVLITDSTLHMHSYETVIIAPTCTTKGYTTYSCECGDTYVDDYVDEISHEYSSKITTPATHLTEGVETFNCECGDTYTEAIAKLTAHTYEEVVTAPTCTTQGYTTYTCACGDSYVDNYTDELDHEYTSEITTEPTHLTEGVKTFTCACGDSYTEPVAKLKEHSYTSEVTTEPTHLTEGAKTFTCACGDSYTEPVAKLEDHTYEEVVTAPTCTAKGYTTYTCACGDTYISDYIGMIAHNYSSSITTPATHLTEGMKTYTCSGCGNGYTEKIAKTPQHTYITSKVTKPSCTDKGYTSHYCECGYSYNDNYTSATGHKYNGQTCVNCGKKCSCNCHKSGFMGFIWKIILFFNKLFKTNKTCACGVSHY